MVVSQKFGVSSTVTEANASTLEQAEYRVRTELELAQDSYRNDPTTPIYRTGQGSANSPAIWCFLSSTLFDCYDTVASSASYVDTEDTITSNLGLIGFVDGCNGQTNDFTADGSLQTLHSLIAQTERNAQHWADLLRASGGALELSKCSSHILFWKFSIQGSPVLCPSFPDITIRVWDTPSETYQTVPILSAYQAHKTLGHYKDPAGNQHEQLKQMKIKSDEEIAFLWKCPLTRVEAWTYCYACYLPSIGFPLSCSSFTKVQLDKLQSKAMSIIIARCGFNRNTKKEVLYGPLALGGASFRHLYVQQGIGHVTLFLKHWRSTTQAGILLRIAVSWFQKQAGVSYHFLENVATSLPQLESKWLLSMREILASMDAPMRLDAPKGQSIQRVHDYYIMDAIHESGRFSLADIRRLNYCRLYLNVDVLSEIATIDGRSLNATILQGDRSLVSSIYNTSPILQKKPSAAEWQLWRRANKLWSTNDGILLQPLGPWTKAIHHQSLTHLSYRYQDTLWIQLSDAQYVRCIPTDRTGPYQELDKLTCPWYDVPTAASPVEVRLTSMRIWKVTGDSSIQLPTPILVQPTATVSAHVTTLEPWEEELLEHTTLFVDPYDFIQRAHRDGLCAVSDGSEWYSTQGSFGWTMSTTEGMRLAAGMGPARGVTPNSYRSESYGMLSMLCFLRQISRYCTYSGAWYGKTATDSLSLIDTLCGRNQERSEKDQDPTNPDPDYVHFDPLTPEWDVVIGIYHLLREFGQLTLEHVRGHQDQKIPYRQLPLLAQLNVDADAKATEYQTTHGEWRPDVLLTEWARAHLVTKKGTITKQYATSLRF